VDAGDLAMRAVAAVAAGTVDSFALALVKHH
jgi:hypothetical protein